MNLRLSNPAHRTLKESLNTEEDAPQESMTQRVQLNAYTSKKKPSVNTRKLVKRLLRETGRAIQDFNMIEDGDRVMVCLSGGKDSYTMLDLLLQLQKKAPVRFELIAVHMDQKQPGYEADVLPSYLNALNIEYHIVERDTYSVVKRVIPEGKTMCGLCSRLRRGTLYGFAEQHGMNKIALGHHRDDITETLFLNLFHGGSLKAMPPKLRSDDGKNIVIRPLSYCRERDIARYADAMAFPIIPCNLCGSQDHLQRQAIKQMLSDWEKDYPDRVNSIFRSIQNVSPSQLADRELFDFSQFTRRSSASQKPSDAAHSHSGTVHDESDTDVKWLP